MTPGIIILEVHEEKDLYEISIKDGHLTQTYYINQFNICQENFICKDDVPDVIVSLRECARSSKDAIAKEYVFQQIVAARITKFCYLCNSKYHDSSSYSNK